MRITEWSSSEISQRGYPTQSGDYIDRRELANGDSGSRDGRKLAIECGELGAIAETRLRSSLES